MLNYEQFINNLLTFDAQYRELFDNALESSKLDSIKLIEVVISHLPDKPITEQEHIKELIEVTQQHISRYNMYLKLHNK